MRPMAAPSPDSHVPIAERLDAWRAQGAHRLDPVRFRVIEAMSRRAAAHEGDARRLLDERLDALATDYAERLAARNADANPAAERSSRQAPAPGALAELVAYIAAQTPPVAGVPDVPSELKTLSHFRSTWSRLSADRRLTQSLAEMPDNAGPLNSQHLVHRALLLMRELSPEYLNHFMAYVDAMSWVEQANAAAAATAATASRAESGRKGRVGKSG